MTRIRVAIAGIGGRASALIQGIEYDRMRGDAEHIGLMRASIGGYRPSDIEIVTAFDMESRTVGTALEEAVFAPPICAHVFASELPASGVEVQMGPSWMELPLIWRETWHPRRFGYRTRPRSRW